MQPPRRRKLAWGLRKVQVLHIDGLFLNPKAGLGVPKSSQMYPSGCQRGHPWPKCDKWIIRESHSYRSYHSYHYQNLTIAFITIIWLLILYYIYIYYYILYYYHYYMVMIYIYIYITIIIILLYNYILLLSSLFIEGCWGLQIGEASYFSMPSAKPREPIGSKNVCAFEKRW